MLCGFPARVAGLILLAASGSGALGLHAAETNQPPPSVEQIQSAIHRGIAFLLKDQNKDGSWGTANQTKDLNIMAPAPGAHRAFRSGVTALCVDALIATGAAATNPAAAEALKRGENWLLENLPRLRRAETITLYNVWGHAYGIQALAAMYQRETSPKRKKQIVKVVESQIDLLRRYESVDGGWGYYDFRLGSKRPATDSTSFVTATVLVALDRARQAGLNVPSNLVASGAASIQRQRKKDNTYLYGENQRYRPMWEINRAGGSLGRSQACNLALLKWGDNSITEEVFGEWLDRLIKRNGWLSIGRKRPVPHESWFLVAGYFFYYGHYYAALCIEQSPKAEQGRFRQDLAGILVPLQEKNGSWWDYPLYNYHQQYGSAFALMSLQKCLPPPNS